MPVIISTFAEELGSVWESIVTFFTGAGWIVVEALAALVIGIIVIRIVHALLRKILLKRTMDNTIANFVLTVVRFALWLLLFFIIASIINIPLTPLVTALGSIALAVGLALKDSLTNLANGVLLIAQKPFAEGQYVDIDGVEGTVKSIGLLTTELISPDNKKIIVPNSKITSACITNFSAKPTRRIDWEFSASYDSDVEKVKSVLLGVLSSHEKILSDPAPMVRLKSQGASEIVFVARAWVNNGDYWDVTWDINEQAFAALNEAGIEIPYPQLDVHLGDKKSKNKENDR